MSAQVQAWLDFVSTCLEGGIEYPREEAKAIVQGKINENSTCKNDFGEAEAGQKSV